MADDGYGISADGLGNVYATGDTVGSLGGTLVGSTDGYLVKLGAGPPGDFNGDGVVNGDDILFWQRGLGRILNVNDLASWRAGIMDDPALTAVPEPIAAILLAAAVFGFFWRRRLGT